MRGLRIMRSVWAGGNRNTLSRRKETLMPAARRFLSPHILSLPLLRVPQLVLIGMAPRVLET